MPAPVQVAPAPAAADLPLRPRHPLRRKLALWTVGLVVLIAAVCATWNDYSARAAMSHRLDQDVALVAQSAATGLAPRLSQGWSPQAHQFLADLTLDQRLAFVAVSDPQGRELYSLAPDAAARDNYLRHRPGPAAGTTQVDRPIYLGQSHDLIARITPIWTQANPGSDRRLDGFVVLALRDRGMAQALLHLRLAHLASACVVCLLSLPVVFWVTRYWTAPLRALMAGIARLSSGQAPVPVAVSGHDELALLAAEFNRMAARLHAARAQLEEANQDLENKVQERTLELRRLNLRLQLESRDRDEFFRAVSHDLGAPLRNIGGMACLLLARHREDLGQDVLAKLERINANVKVQSGMIEDLLELSRLRSRTGQREPLDLGALLAELQNTLGYDLERAGISLEIRAPLPTIVAERNRIRQVFQNLLDNAIKYMQDAPTRRITISCATTANTHRFTVADTGPGIAPEDLPRLFQVFQRGRSPANLKVPGRGIGLAAVKAIVESYGGTITADTAPGQGAAFHFTLDRHLVEDPGPAAAPEPAANALSVHA